MRPRQRITHRITLENALGAEGIEPPVRPGWRRVVRDVKVYSSGYPSRWRIEGVFVDEEEIAGAAPAPKGDAA